MEIRPIKHYRETIDITEIMKKLPKLSEYVTKLESSTSSMGECFWYVRNYKNLITQPLSLDKFVPAVFKDGKWVVLEEPKCWSNFIKYSDISIKGLKPGIYEYQTALSKVIFKGFEYNKVLHQIKTYNPYCCLDTWGLEKKTIECLIHYNLEVNESIIEKYKL